MAASGGMIAMRAFRHAFKKTKALIKIRIANLSRPEAGQAQTILARVSPRQAVHPIARIQQAKGRWYTTHSTINAAIRRCMSTAPTKGARYDRSTFPKSATATAVSRLTIRTPFASTLRPNLTGGALPRSAGGYSLGGNAGGARYFSHTPAAPAQVINNVSQACRAFWLSGQKAHFDGMTPAGEKRFRSVTTLQQETFSKMQAIPINTPGSFIDFQINPTITALSPLGAFSFNSPAGESVTLNSDGFLDVLSVDFARALKDLAATMNDLKSLSALGDLPITLVEKTILRVRFPGCDAETVERLCDEVGVLRGTICQDEDFESATGTHMALLFPFAPSEHHLSSPGGSLRSLSGHDYEEFVDEIAENPWMDGYETMSEGESAYFTKPTHSSHYEGLEGIYRFIEQCDNARRI